jgi:hypothetical protein
LPTYLELTERSCRCRFGLYEDTDRLYIASVPEINKRTGKTFHLIVFTDFFTSPKLSVVREAILLENIPDTGTLALLAGSVGLFGLLGAIMYLTRKINWHDPTGKMQTDGNTP